MAFPFDYSGEISCGSILSSNVESFQHTFMEKVRERLEKVNASVEIRGTEISFRRPTPGFNSIFNFDAALLATVPYCKFILNPEEGMIRYYLNFRKYLIIFSAAFWGLLGSFFIFVVHGPLAGRVGIVTFVWLFMIVGTTLTGISRFKQFVNRILSEMHVSQL